ncbi:MAG: hypothetical protein AAGG51_27920 [Cyanobacteria bacterium P01_G01_bin.54]
MAKRTQIIEGGDRHFTVRERNLNFSTIDNSAAIAKSFCRLILF